jgi:hypothetical protein
MASAAWHHHAKLSRTEFYGVNPWNGCKARLAPEVAEMARSAEIRRWDSTTKN